MYEKKSGNKQLQEPLWLQAALEGLLERLGLVLGRLEGLLDGLGGILGASWRSGSHLGTVLGAILASLGTILGVSGASLARKTRIKEKQSMSRGLPILSLIWSDF